MHKRVSLFGRNVDFVVGNVTRVALKNGGFGVMEVDGYALAQFWKSVPIEGCSKCLQKVTKAVRGCVPKEEMRGMNIRSSPLCTPPIVHRDLKTSNILLTENMQAKIADFGLSKAFVTENASHISTRPVGTRGHLDPEFHKLGNLNRKSDIYSIGIILFELIIAQLTVLRGSKYNIHVLQWVTPAIEKGNVRSIIDPKLKGEFNTNAVWKVEEIAMACTQPTSNKRPDISHVLAELKDCLAPNQMAPKKPQTMQTTNLIITS
ncbi:probable LRR receptor-like serine/threonine-protein kinase At1g51880 [Durio zibethinus]|uniref:Probable LRR receptor-like serine/threonine-protein kinase At1g51880 n=1 Tax=Durio zibethinus TaxID=66656 RepID=A0A6P6ABE2_DURZI|nr:probable LRR receptor-like serine/threonine-protein kinase At1g51880 [Durio zibethinus]